MNDRLNFVKIPKCKRELQYRIQNIKIKLLHKQLYTSYIENEILEERELSDASFVLTDIIC